MTIDHRPKTIDFKKMMIQAKRSLVFGLLSLVLFVSFSIAALAEDISVEATVTTNQLTLGNSGQLIVSVHGTQKVEPVSVPSIDGLDVRYLGPQTQVSVVNGNYSTSKSFIYTLFPNKTGSFTIPSISLSIDGKDYRTNHIVINVEDTPKAASGGASSSSNDNVAASLKDKIMLIMGAPQKDVYVGEQIPVTIKLMYTGVTISEIQYPSFDFVGFTKDEFAQPGQSQQVINGVGYNIVDFKIFVSPTRTGDLVLGPSKIDANLIYRSGGQSNPFGSSSDIFDTFFNSYEKRVLTATSQSLRFNVLPLPEEGKPADFSGAVGHFDFNVTVSPNEVNVGDPITMRMKIIGEGNLKPITIPSFNDSKFKMYDPQIKSDGNSKVLEQVIVPSSDKIKEVPAVQFSYFDIQEKKYKTITQGPFTINLKAPKPGDEFKAVGFEANAPNVTIKEDLGRDIVFIKERLGAIRPQGYHIYKTVWFWLIILLYWAGWIACLVLYLLRRKISTDKRFARRFKAPRQARKGLGEAQTFMRAGKTKEFYGAVIKTLTDYLGNQLHIPSGGMTFASIEGTLHAKKVDDQVILSIKTIFEAADMVRFASMKLDDGNMNKTFESLKTIIDHLEGCL